MADLRVGIVGAGGIVRSRHLPGLRAIPGVRVVAVCNRTLESGEAVARAWDIPVVRTRWREVARADDVDAVLVGTWPDLHAPISIAALEAGKHVFCQARMARTAAEARAMLTAADAHPGQVAMLCPAPDGMRGDRFVRQLIGAGYLGAPCEVYAAGLSSGNADPNAPLHWRQDFARQGYNTLTLGLWAEIIHRWVGPHSRVSAVLKTHTPSRVDPETGRPTRVRVAESVAIAAELRSGAVGCYRFSGVARHAPRNRIELYGSEGSLSYDLATDEITGGRARDAAAAPLPVPAELARRWSVEGDWVRAIREGGPVEPSFGDGWLYMELTEAVYRSHEQGRAITLPLAPEPA
ncbi:MAG: Gfo/Idh/MocA family oxidoreductase [Chthonomonadales bacterium]|nr:Gfo/Idh/MocA family oxidoreductase [Chthonomonadales bacterium]